MPSGFFVDMDDTLYPEWAYVESGYRAVADAMPVPDMDADAFFEHLKYEHGKYGRYRIFNRLAETLGLDDTWIRAAVDRYRGNQPQALSFYPGALEALANLRAIAPVALVTDGALAMQEAKVAALGLANHVDLVVYTAMLARPKPCADAFEHAASALGFPASEAVLIGDDPLLDLEAAQTLGCRCIRVRTGRFVAVEPRDEARPSHDCEDIRAAVRHIRAWA